MDYFTLDGNRSADIFPSTYLTYCQHITVAEPDIRVGFAGKRFCNWHFLMLTDNAFSILHDVTGQISGLSVRATFESASDSNQLCCAHLHTQRIATGLCNL